MTQTPPSVLSFDIEDWHQLVEWKLNGRLPASSGNVLRQTDLILDALARHDVRATFFILGLVSEAHPDLVKRIQKAGHEVGSHGWSHTLIYRQTPDAFREETRRSKLLLEDQIGGPVFGYRAAEFSITNASRWALDVLAELGFQYDSSIFPIQGARYGIVDQPLTPHTIQTASGPIVEVPLTAVDWRGKRWPIGGGGYFRLFPWSVTRRALARVSGEGRSPILYFHPYEFSRPWLVPRLDSVGQYFSGARYVVFHNFNRGRNRARFERLLRDGQFITLKELVARG